MIQVFMLTGKKYNTEGFWLKTGIQHENNKNNIEVSLFF